MFANLISKKRKGEPKENRDRTDRFSKVGDFWFFKTREGLDIGPFASRSDAQYALLYFVERSEWPDDEQLKDFIEGCKHYVGVSDSSMTHA